jgi:predicted nuclease of predicted toxin-antitoxin system
MDENVPRQITVGLRLRGIDVITVQEEQRSGQSDPEILARATDLNRVLFSQDDDMLALANERQQVGAFFPGVIYVRPRNSSIGDCVRDLELIAKVCTVEDCHNTVQYLPL